MRPIPTTLLGPTEFLVNKKSVLFDGTDEYVSAATPGLTTFSVVVWIKTTDTTGGIIEWSVGTARYGIAMINGLPTIVYGVKHRRPAAGGINDGDWHCVIVEYDTITPLLFVDNATITLGAENNASAGVADIMRVADVTVGVPGLNCISCNLTQLSIWNKVLDSDERTEIYNGGTPLNLRAHSAVANLVSWWPIDGDTFPTLRDNKGSNNGTMTNMDAEDIVEDAP